MPTVRINIPAVAALNGINPAPPTAIITDNKAEQLKEITLSPLDVFGFFDPGSVFGQQSADMMLTHFLLSSDAPLGIGSGVFVTPPNWLSTGAPDAAARPLFIAGVTPGFTDGQGVMGEGSCLPIPVAHGLSFNTFGDDLGPYVIQMTFNPMPKVDQDWTLPPTINDIIIPDPE